MPTSRSGLTRSSRQGVSSSRMVKCSGSLKRTRLPAISAISCISCTPTPPLTTRVQSGSRARPAK